MLTSSMWITLAVIVAVVMVLLWLTNLLGLPGNWFMLLAAVLYWLGVRDVEAALTITWVTLVALAFLAAVGELVEFIASSAAASGAGGSRRSVALALVGSLAGAVVGLFVALPIPVVGPLIGAVLFGGLGAFLGAALGEKWKGRTTDESLAVGTAAFWGRLLGTLSKSAVGFLMVLWFVGSLIF